MTITLDSELLFDIVSRATQHGVERGIEQANINQLMISSAEIKKMKDGHSLFKSARADRNIKWIPIGKGGRTSGVNCLRSSFETFLTNRQFDFNKK